MSELTFDQVVDAYAPAEQSVRVCVRGDLVAQLERLEADLVEARDADENENRHPKAPKIAKQIEELQAVARGHEVEFVFRSIGRKAWSDLVSQHPPTKKQKAELKGNQRLEWNPETFPIAAVAESCIKPAGVTEDAVQRIADEWTHGQWQLLWNACLAANIKVNDVPSSVAASAILHGSEQRSEPARTAASHEASSSDE